MVNCVYLALGKADMLYGKESVDLKQLERGKKRKYFKTSKVYNTKLPR